MADSNSDTNINGSCTNSPVNNPIENSNESPNSQQSNESENVENDNAIPRSERLQNIRRRLNFNDNNEDSDYDSDDTMLRCTENEAEEKMMKWNFDFKNEIPLNGDWDWERISVECPPAADLVSSMKRDDENRNI